MKDYKRELAYSVIIFVVLEALQIPSVLASLTFYYTAAGLGLLLLVFWIVFSYFFYSSRQISKYSSILVKATLKKRLFPYFVLPVATYSMLVLYLYFNRVPFLAQLLIAMAVAMYFFLFVHIRSSFEKLYEMTRETHGVFSFTGMVLFYLSVSVVANIFTRPGEVVIITVLLASLILLYVLMTHNQVNMLGLFIYMFSLLFITVATYSILKLNIFAYPLFMTTAFYLVVSLWNIRLMGYRKIGEYITPFIFSLMAVILIFSF